MPLGLLKSAKNYAGQRQKAYSGEAVKCEKVAMSESASSQRLLPPLTSPEEATVNWSTSVSFYHTVPNLHILSKKFNFRKFWRAIKHKISQIGNYDKLRRTLITFQPSCVKLLPIFVKKNNNFF